MRRLNELTNEEREKYLPLLEQKDESPEDFNDYYLTFDYDGNPYWIYYPDVDFIDFL